MATELCNCDQATQPGAGQHACANVPPEALRIDIGRGITGDFVRVSVGDTYAEALDLSPGD